MASPFELAKILGFSLNKSGMDMTLSFCHKQLLMEKMDF